MEIALNMAMNQVPGNSGFNLVDIPGLQLLELPKRDLASAVPALVGDYSGNGNTGSFEGSMELNQVVGRSFFRFDGTDDYISFGTDISLVNNFSISVLFKTTDTSFSLLSKYDTGANQRGFQFIISPTGNIDIYESANGITPYQRTIDAAVAYNAGGANFVTWAKAGAVLKSYVNGVEKVVTFVDATTVAALHNSTSPLLSGARMNSGVPGYFGEWDKGALIVNSGILSLSDHQRIYNSPEIQSIKAGM